MRGLMTHPDADVLAEFRAGLVAGRRRARIASHLTGCERCTGLSDQLGEISTLLAAVPAAAMPDAVAQRLENVLAAEVARRDDAERAGAERPPGHAKPPRPSRGWGFRLVALRVLAPAAGVMLLAAGGYGLSRIGASSTSSVAAGSEAASGAAAVPPSAAASRPEAGPAFEAPARFGVMISTTNYHHATLQRQLELELRLHPRTPGSTQELADGPVKGCVLLVTKGISPVTLVLVQKAYYESRPANVIVAVRGDHNAAWVTTPTCSGGSDHVLDTTTLPGTTAP